MVEPELDAVAATLYTPLYARAHAAELVPKAGVFDSAAAELLARSGRAGEQLAAFMAGTRRQFGTGTQLLADYFHPRAALSGRHPIVKATGAQFCSGARDGRALADLAAGWTLLAEHDVMSWISPIHRAAALAFRILSGGGRLYSVAQLVAI